MKYMEESQQFQQIVTSTDCVSQSVKANTTNISKIPSLPQRAQTTDKRQNYYLGWTDSQQA